MVSREVKGNNVNTARLYKFEPLKQRDNQVLHQRPLVSKTSCVITLNLSIKPQLILFRQKQ